jgi:hypothetical protein
LTCKFEFDIYTYYKPDILWHNFKWSTNAFRLSLFEPGLHLYKCARVNVASHTAAIRASFLEVVSNELAADGMHLTLNTRRVLGGQVVVRRFMLYGLKKNISQFLVRAALSEARL